MPTGTDPTPLVLYGGGGHGKTLIDLVRAQGHHRAVGIVDRGLEPGQLVRGVPVRGDDGVLATLREEGVAQAVNGIGGITRPADRTEAFERLAAAGFAFPALVHPSAVVEPDVVVPDGAQVLALAYVGTDVVLGFGVIVNTGAIVSHDCVLADQVNLSPGALLAGGVRVGTEARVGMGATVNLGLRVGAGARIGNGATVKADVPDGQVVHAGSVWPPRQR